MKAALIAISVLFGVFLTLAIITATPLVGEVVTLHTRAADGTWETTPLWIVDGLEGTYLRAGDPDSSWVVRWRDDPAAKLERQGKISDVRLFAEPGRRESINAQMSERYGWADDFVGLMGDRSVALPLRVEYGAGG